MSRIFDQDVIRTLALDVLQRSRHEALAGRNDRGWTLQGFGMLRLYFGRKWRMHVWDSALRFPDVSTIHDHLQWDFESLVISGHLRNFRFVEGEGEPMMRMLIQTGTGGHSIAEPEQVLLRRVSEEVYARGDIYRQKAAEVHESVPEDGCVTIVRRDHTNAGDVAKVFWPVGGKWGSAEPREATPAEIAAACGKAIDRWDDL